MGLLREGEDRRFLSTCRQRSLGTRAGAQREGGRDGQDLVGSRWWLHPLSSGLPLPCDPGSIDMLLSVLRGRGPRAGPGEILDPRPRKRPQGSSPRKRPKEEWVNPCPHCPHSVPRLHPFSHPQSPHPTLEGTGGHSHKQQDGKRPGKGL